MHKILALFLCLAACSIDSGTTPDVGMMLASDGATGAPRDGGVGGRISVPQYRVEGVPLTQLTFYDRTLDTYCFPRKTTAGLRCVPNGVFLLNYADAGCTQLAGTLTSCSIVTYGLAPITGVRAVSFYAFGMPSTTAGCGLLGTSFNL